MDLLVENFAAECDKDFLTLYIESVTGKEDITVEFWPEHNAAIVCFTDVPDNETQDIIEQIIGSNKSMKMKDVKVSRVPERDSALVTRIKSGVHSEMIEMFFEQELLNPHDAFLGITVFDDSKNAAIIKYKSAADVQYVLIQDLQQCKYTSVLGNDIKLEICPLKIQLKGLKCLQVDSTLLNIQFEKLEIDSETHQEAVRTARHCDSPSGNSQKLEFESDSSTSEDKYCEYVQQSKRTESYQKYNRIHATACSDSNFRPKLNQEISPNCNSATYASHCSDYVREKNQGKFSPESKVAQSGSQRGYGPSRSQKFKSAHVMSLEKSKERNFSSNCRKLYMEHNVRDDDNNNNDADEKCQLLKCQESQIKRGLDGDITVNTQYNRVYMSAWSEDILNAIYCRVLEQLEIMYSIRIDLSHSSGEMKGIMLGKVGQKWLQHVFQNLKYKDRILSYTKGDNYLYLMAVNEELALSSYKYLLALIHTEKIAFSQSHKQYLQTNEWRKCLDNVKAKSTERSRSERSFSEILAVHVDDQNSQIIIEGTHNSVKTAKSMIEKNLQDNNIHTEVIQCKYSQMCMLKLKDKSHITSAKVSIEIDEKDKSVKLSGVPHLVKSAKSDVEKLLSSVSKEELNDICFPGITKAEVTKRGSLLHSLIQQLQDVNNCVILCSDPKSQDDSVWSEAKALGKNLLKHPKSQDESVWSDAIALGRKLFGLEKNIHTQKGDITRFTADVLVNPLSGDNPNDLNKSGAVSAAFVKAGGQELCQAFSKMPVFQKDIGAITPAYGQLKNNTKKLFYIHLKKYNKKDESSSEEKLKERIVWCLKKAEQLKLESIAFPTIGCGGLDYPPEVVARCFKEAAKDSSNVQITVLSQSDDILKAFSKHVPQVSLDDPLKSKELKECRERHKVKRHPLIFQIYAFNSDTCKKVKQEIKDRVVKHCTSILSLPCGEKILSVKEAERILSLQSQNVQIDIGEPKGKISISGLKEDVERVHSKVGEIICQSKAVADSGLGTIQAPSYWRHYHGDITKSHDSDAKQTLLDPKDPLYSALEKMILGTWHKDSVGKGNDAQGLGQLGQYKIVVDKIHMVENASMFKKYDSFKKHVGDPKGGKLPDVQSLPEKKDIETMAQVGDSTKKNLNKDVNECYLLHGTAPDKLGCIIKTGLDSRLCSTESLFGQGIYFAESSTKADQYADDRMNRKGLKESLFMLVVRVTLGKIHVCQKPQQFRRPPCSDHKCASDTCTKHLPYCDSVIGTHAYSGAQAAQVQNATRKLLFREFVVYKAEQCYPEFIVKYHRE